jgi:hypothetical protein
MEVMTELALVEQFRAAKRKKEEADEALGAASKEFDTVERELMEMLEAKGATTTAKYQGVGYVTLTKPRVYASYLKENQGRLFDFLKGRGREDLIKEVVAPQSLSGFVKELLEEGQSVPECIGYYLKAGARFYEA